jgi:MFS family permease
MPTTSSFAPFLSRYVDALRYRDFVRIWLGSLGGQSAYWALIVARGMLVLEMTGSSALVGITTFAAMAPRFVVPPLAGYLADRFDRRNVLFGSYFFQMLTSGLLTGLAFADLLEIWQLIVLSLANGIFRTFQMSATQSLVPNLVAREHLLNALALNQLTLQGSRLVGPALVAPALLLVGPEAAFLVSTLFYVGSIVSISTIRTKSSGGLQRGASLRSSFSEALRYAWSHPQLRSLFIIIALHCSMTMAFESMLPVFARDELGEDKLGVTYLMMGTGGGAVVAIAAIAGLRDNVMRGRLLLVAGVISGASMFALALSENITTAILATAAMGGSQAAFMVVGGAMVQSLAPDEMRGRIAAINQINIGGTMAVVNLVNGFAADAIGAPNVLMILGASFVFVMAASLMAATLRGVYRGSITISPRPAPAAVANEPAKA